MLIRCPECSICYRIDTSFMPKNGMKFRCAKCGRVWLCHPEDAFEESEEDVEIYKVKAQNAAQNILDSQEPENKPDVGESSNQEQLSHQEESTASENTLAEVDGQLSADIDSIPPSVNETSTDENQTTPTENSDQTSNQPSDQSQTDTSDKIDEKDLAMSSDMAQIFSRLNKQVELIDDENAKTSLKEKLLTRILYNIRENRLLKWLIIGVAVILGILIILSYRYEITRHFSWMEGFYNMIGLESKIIGEGLEFHNISHREYEEDYVRKMEIRGYIYNGTDTEQTIPTISISVMDKDGNLIQSQTEQAPKPSIKPRERAAFRAIITQPSTLSKYVLVTFEQKP